MAGVCVCVTYIFYNNAFYAPLTLLFVPVLWRSDKEKYISNTKQRLRLEFKDVIVILAGNLNVGYSLENAFVRTEREIRRLYGDKSLLEDELHVISNGLNYNRTLEQMLLELGERSDIEEIRECGELLVISKQYGGNMINIIHQIASNLSERLSVELEIQTAISAKKLESKIMLLTPFVIITYMRIINQSYICILYETVLGKAVMTAALLVLVFAAMWSERIVRIEV